MKNVKIVPTTVLGGLAQALILTMAFSLSSGVQAHDSCPPDPDAKHSADHPHCVDGGGGGGGQGSEIATNDITVRWDGAVNGTGLTPRECVLGADPQPNGTHTWYGCVQEPVHTISVNLTGGDVLSTKGSPTPEDVAACATGFTFSGVYPNNQFVVAASGEVCTDPDGCPLIVNTAMNNQLTIPDPYTFVKLVGHGRIAQSENLNPFSCPADGSAPTTLTTPLDAVELRVKEGKGSKAGLVCLFDVTGTTSMQVTPVCP